MFFIIVLNFLFNLYIICGDSIFFSSKYFLFCAFSPFLVFFSEVCHFINPSEIQFCLF